MTRICLFGASVSTSNLGVSALYDATVSQLLDRAPELELTVFDFAWGRRELPFVWAGGRREVEHLGANQSRRYWRPDTLPVMRIMARTGLPGNPGVRRLREAAAVLDLSGGDSFTDLYGVDRFRTTIGPKQLALEVGTPLLLLPQTYGPFASAERRVVAANLVRGSRAAWARDAWSHARLEELLGDAFDPARHLLGVDVAFGLERRESAGPLSRRAEEWLAAGSGPVVGVNVSGLVHGSADEARERYGFRADYPAAMRGLLAGLLAEDGVRVLLVPHVLAPPGHPESDPEACRRLLEALPGEARDRVEILPGPYEAGEVKHLIARLDWFCGTRMHATIAALSTGVPCAAVAYSPKFAGVFETCRQQDHVADPTTLSTEELVAALLDSFRRRTDARASLAAALPGVRAKLGRQFDRLVAEITRA